MSRSAHTLPSVAQKAASDLIVFAVRKATEIHDQLEALSRDRRRVTDDDDRAGRQYREVLASVYVELRREGASKHWAKHRAAAGKRSSALKQAYEKEGAEREAQLRALKAEEKCLEGRLDAARSLVARLRVAQDSALGLAPWDTDALEALRYWGEMPAEPDGGASPLMKGSEVVALVQERLGISRSAYYERYRHLLRSYNVTPARVEWLVGGGAVLHRGATQRFRREEVEALLRFLAAKAA